MILATHGIVGSSIVQFAFDADYQAVLDYATTQGYTLPSAGQQILQNQLVVDLKDAGVWSKLDTFAVFANDVNISNPIPNPYSNAFALVDWKRLSLYTAVNSPTFTVNQGFTGNGTSSYINTNFNPTINGINYKLNNASFGGYKDSVTASSSWVFGTLSGNNNIRNTNNANHRINSTNTLSASVNFGIVNFIGLNRTSMTNVQPLTNQTVGNLTQTSTAMPDENLFIFRNSGSYLGGVPILMYFAGADITSVYGDFYDAWDNYIDSI
jgi:hypothetical protein